MLSQGPIPGPPEGTRRELPERDCGWQGRDHTSRYGRSAPRERRGTYVTPTPNGTVPAATTPLTNDGHTLWVKWPAVYFRHPRSCRYVTTKHDHLAAHQLCHPPIATAVTLQ